MSESRKTLDIEGGQVKDDDHIASYKPIPESDTDFRKSKSSLSKSKEKVSDGAEEKLLKREKEDEAKIVTKVDLDMAEAKFVAGDHRNGDAKIELDANKRVDLDMAEAKFVAGDHRNGDAKIELDANKRQFSGLTKEELLKYAEDPFWVRLRWAMFVLFWALWLCMLAGAIAIIVRAPKCAAPPPKTWYQMGPLADRSAAPSFKQVLSEYEPELKLLSAAKVQGVFVSGCENAYDVLDDPAPSCLANFKTMAAKAKEFGVKLIVDITANFVPKSHAWFAKSENRTEGFSDYFVWAAGKDTDASGHKEKPNNWYSTLNEDAWTWSDKRQQYYLHQFANSTPDLNFTNPAVVAHFDAVLKAWMAAGAAGVSDQQQQYYLHQFAEGTPDLNFTNPAVVALFDAVLKAWMAAGAAGVRLHKARQLLVNSSLADEKQNTAYRGSKPGYEQYLTLLHDLTSDQPQLDSLLAHWSHVVATATSDPTVFTLAEDGILTVEWHRLERNSSCLRPPSLAPVNITAERNLTAVAESLGKGLGKWPAVQLISERSEIATLAMLLPATPVLGNHETVLEANDTVHSFAELAKLRRDASLQHGLHALAAVPAANSTQQLANSTQQLLACARWKLGHTGYLALFNPGDDEAHANVTSLPAVPRDLTVYHASAATREHANYTSNHPVVADDILVPGKATVVLAYVPRTAAEQ